MIIELLLIIVVILLIFLIYLFKSSTKFEKTDFELAISKIWGQSGLSEKIGKLENYAADMRDSHRSIEQMLRVPKGKAYFGELSLETILSDYLPPDMFGIRKRIFDGKVPDANIRSFDKIICIDSKFPLDNYKNMINTESENEKEYYKKQFLRDVKGNLDKICADYVCPDKGSAEFAFAYIPSEGVYYFLICEAYEMLMEYTKYGVQLVSPLTLSHKLELIKAGVHAKKLSEEAQKVKEDIIRLSHGFSDLDNKWKIFYETHLRNAGNKAEEIDRSYKNLRDEFDRISRLS